MMIEVEVFIYRLHLCYGAKCVTILLLPYWVKVKVRHEAN